jgi:hypothetical protein
MSEGYRDLIAWRKAKSVALHVYRCTRSFPKDEVYGLSSQMRRAAVSVPSNIAEGKGRYSQKEFVQFLYHCSRIATRIADPDFHRPRSRLSRFGGVQKLGIGDRRARPNSERPN